MWTKPTKRALSLIAVAGIVSLGTWAALRFNIEIPKEERAANGFDYWLNRYQTLATGIMAIVGAAFAIYASKLSIRYDREKVAKQEDEARRAAIRTVARMVGYAWKMLHSKLNFMKVVQKFPDDIYPVILLEYEALEREIIASIRHLPSNLTIHCLYLAYAMKFFNGRIEQLVKAGRRDAKNLDREKMILTAHLEGLRACCNILIFELEHLTVATAPIENSDFDVLSSEVVELAHHQTQSQKQLIYYYLKEMGMVPTDQAKDLYDGQPFLGADK